eukprot:SAG31_NODE_828_length_11716_cov_4.405785_1_plen_77_part_00
MEIQIILNFNVNLGRTKFRSILNLVLEEYLPVLEKYEYSCVRSTGGTHLVRRAHRLVLAQLLCCGGALRGRSFERK